jgi:hypothetical protein
VSKALIHVWIAGHAVTHKQIVLEERQRAVLDAMNALAD